MNETTPHVDDLVAGYLLGALERHESTRVDAHLPQCASCQRVYDESRELLAVLPAGAEDLSPRAHVKRNLLAAAAGEQQPSHPRVTRIEERRAWAQVRQWAPVTAAAAAVVAIVVGLTSWSLVLNERLDERNEELARFNQLVDSVAGSGAVLTMEGTDAAPGLRAALVVPEDGRGVVVLADNVPAPAPGQAYHLWLFDGETPVYGGTLVPDDNGHIVRTLPDVELAQFERMEVDAQPEDAGAPGGVTVVGGELN